MPTALCGGATSRRWVSTQAQKQVCERSRAYREKEPQRETGTTHWRAVPTVPVSESLITSGGAAVAAVTLVQYGDYECPYPGAAYPIKEVQARMGECMRFVFRNFSINGARHDDGYELQ